MYPHDPRDPWLERWLPAIQASAAQGRVLELGCDTGRDTVVLAASGLAVTALDLSAEALQACRASVPQARLLQHDLRDRLPFGDEAFGVVLASLCLHYFEWDKTVAIVADIRRCLRPGGLLLCRLNSTRDIHHGAADGVESASGLRVVHGTYSVHKRFFAAGDLDALFDRGWKELAREETTIRRYEQPKVAWELGLVKAQGDGAA